MALLGSQRETRPARVCVIPTGISSITSKVKIPLAQRLKSWTQYLFAHAYPQAHQVHIGLIEPPLAAVHTLLMPYYHIHAQQANSWSCAMQSPTTCILQCDSMFACYGIGCLAIPLGCNACQLHGDSYYHGYVAVI